MSITENFLVNTKNFEAIIEKLRTASQLPNKITNKFLEQLGYSNPSDLLVLHLFKDLDMLTDDGSPTPLFKKFRAKGEDKQALAEGIVHAYAELFQSNSHVHKLPQEELKDEFRKFFGSSKSDLILKYMAGTFTTLVNYAEPENIERASKAVVKKDTDPGVESNVKQVSENQQNGHSKPPSPDKMDEEVTVAAQNDSAGERIRKEEKGEKAIEDFIKNSLASDSPDTSSEDSKPEQDSVHPRIRESSASRSEPPSPPPSQTDAEEETDRNSDDADIVEHTDAGDIMPFSPKTDSNTGKNHKFEINETFPDTTPESDDAPESVQDHKSDTDHDHGEDPFGLQEEDMITEFDADTDAADVDEDAEESLDPTAAESETAAGWKAESNDFVDKAILKKAELLFKLKKYEEALPAFKKVIDRYGESEDSQIQEQVTKAVLRRASILNKTERYDEALPAFDEVFTRFEHSDNPEYYKHASIALIKQVQILEMLGLEEQLVPLYDKIIERFSDSGDPKYAKYVDKACIKQAEIVLESDDPEKALEAANNVIKRFKDSGSENKLLEKAMFMKAELLEELGRDAEALKAYDIYLDTYGDIS